jgi:hypothetical protein
MISLQSVIRIKGQLLKKSPNMAQLDICDVLRAISDDKALAIFNTVALAADSSGNALLSRLKITRKQYYSRMSALINSDLVVRKNGKYFLTSFGKVVYKVHTLIGRAKHNYWKLKAVDAMESSHYGLSVQERDGFINSLIEENDLKQILLSSNENKELLVSLAVPKIPRQNIDV